MDKLLVVESGARIPAAWTADANTVILRQFDDEPLPAFGKRIAATKALGNARDIVYLASRHNSPARFRGRCLTARALLRSIANGARASLTFVADGAENVGHDLFALVDVLSEHLTASGPTLNLVVSPP